MNTKNVNIVSGKFLSGYVSEFAKTTLLDMHYGGKEVLIISDDYSKWKSLISKPEFAMVNSEVGVIRISSTLVDILLDKADEIIIEDKVLLHHPKILHSNANVTLLIQENS